MPSNTYTATKFYELQSSKKVAKNISQDKKLLKDNKGYYLVKSTPNGDMYRQRVKSNDYVYARSSSEGVTLYRKELDKSKRTYALKEGTKEHNKHLHFGDRVADTGKKYDI